MRVTRHDGRSAHHLVGAVLQPDVAAAPTIAGLRAGRDEVLERESPSRAPRGAERGRGVGSPAQRVTAPGTRRPGGAHRAKARHGAPLAARRFAPRHVGQRSLV